METLVQSRGESESSYAEIGLGHEFAFAGRPSPPRAFSPTLIPHQAPEGHQNISAGEDQGVALHTWQAGEATLSLQDGHNNHQTLGYNSEASQASQHLIALSSSRSHASWSPDQPADQNDEANEKEQISICPNKVGSRQFRLAVGRTDRANRPIGSIWVSSGTELSLFS